MIRLRRLTTQQRIARARALAGAQKLTAHEKGGGWAGRVNLKTLEVDSCTTCVLGQLYGTYYRGLMELGFEDSDLDRQECGFTLRAGDTSGVTFADLDAAWRKIIRELR